MREAVAAEALYFQVEAAAEAPGRMERRARATYHRELTVLSLTTTLSLPGVMGEMVGAVAVAES
jgi:hypothetical protein